MRIFALFSAALISLCGTAQTAPKDTVRVLSSIDVRVDLAGMVMDKVGMGFTQFEGGVRVGFNNKYFPILEFGYGMSDFTGETTTSRSRSRSPFARIGMDYNFTKTNHNASRFTLGLRYAFSTYKYDLFDHAFADDVWGVSRPLDEKGIHGSTHWMEMVASTETRLWRMIHFGWSVRYKFQLTEKGGDVGSPFYIPGYGQNKGIMWGLNFFIIYVINDKL